MTVKKASLKAVLEEIKVNGPKYREVGICYNAKAYFYSHIPSVTLCDDIGLLLDKMVKKWPKSLDDLFPVEGEGVLYSSNADKWDPETTAGQRRLELLDWLIENLQ